MTILEALRLCLHGGHRVRPVCWREYHPDRWVERQGGYGVPAVLSTTYRDLGGAAWVSRWVLPYAALATGDEVLGEWEVIDDATT